MLVERPKGNYESAIDRALEGLITVTRMAASLVAEWTPHHGLILASAAVSVAEDYFRSITVDAAGVCPLIMERCDEIETRIEFIRLGSVDEALRDSLSGTTFSNKDTIVDVARLRLGFDPSKNAATKFMLDQFEIVCHVRHCSVHSGGYVGRRNSRALGVAAGSWIGLQTPAAVHSIVGVVASTIRSFNQGLLERIIAGWLQSGLLSGTWQVDKTHFEPMWRAFASDIDIAHAVESGLVGFPRSAYAAWRTMAPAFRSRAAV